MNSFLLKIHNRLPENMQKFFVIYFSEIKIFAVAFLIFGIIVSASFGCDFGKKKNAKLKIDAKKGGYEAALINYKDEVLIYAKEYDLSPEYLLALIILESSGKREVNARFEKGIYRKLKNLQNKKIDKFENIYYEDIADADNEALKNLSRSWGPFQIMGYKCVRLGITVAELRGEERVKWAIKWISDDYGKMIREKRYKDAFHFHNTGKVYPKNGKPKTHDPNYVANGLKHMEYFKKALAE